MKHQIIVSEPWDFKNKEGTNIIEGEIKDIINPNCIIFKSKELLKFNNIESDLLVLTSRYEKQELYNEDIIDGTITGGLLIVKNIENLDEELLIKNSEYVIIGTIKKM